MSFFVIFWRNVGKNRASDTVFVEERQISREQIFWHKICRSKQNKNKDIFITIRSKPQLYWMCCGHPLLATVFVVGGAVIIVYVLVVVLIIVAGHVVILCLVVVNKCSLGDFWRIPLSLCGWGEWVVVVRFYVTAFSCWFQQQNITNTKSTTKQTNSNLNPGADKKKDGRCLNRHLKLQDKLSY